MPTILDRVISGLRAGADRGGIRAARSCNLATGGLMPAGSLTEDGSRPEFAGRWPGSRERIAAARPG